MAASVRLFNLELLGPFIDETIHIYSLDKFSLGDRAIISGKFFGSILFYYTTRWTDAPLYTSRLLIWAIGVTTTIAVYLTTERIGGRKAAILAGFFGAMLPYITFHDRLALNDPLISFFYMGRTCLSCY